MYECLTGSSYKYRQDSNFWYLTGFEEPHSAMILEKTSDAKGHKMTLFTQGKDSHREKWEGARLALWCEERPPILIPLQHQLRWCMRAFPRRRRSANIKLLLGY
jgi:Xaa-Pro aminopeptidase